MPQSTSPLHVVMAFERYFLCLIMLVRTLLFLGVKDVDQVETTKYTLVFKIDLTTLSGNLEDQLSC